MDVPDEVNMKIEVEIGDDERELEIELTWWHEPGHGSIARSSLSCPGSRWVGVRDAQGLEVPGGVGRASPGW